MKTCYDLYKSHDIKYQCCVSCHEDWEDLDVEMIYLEFKGKAFHVCCKGSQAVEGLEGAE